MQPSVSVSAELNIPLPVADTKGDDVAQLRDKYAPHIGYIAHSELYTWEEWMMVWFKEFPPENPAPQPPKGVLRPGMKIGAALFLGLLDGLPRVEEQTWRETMRSRRRNKLWTLRSPSVRVWDVNWPVLEDYDVVRKNGPGGVWYQTADVSLPDPPPPVTPQAVAAEEAKGLNSLWKWVADVEHRTFREWWDFYANLEWRPQWGADIQYVLTPDFRGRYMKMTIWQFETLLSSILQTMSMSNADRSEAPVGGWTPDDASQAMPAFKWEKLSNTKRFRPYEFPTVESENGQWYGSSAALIVENETTQTLPNWNSIIYGTTSLILDYGAEQKDGALLTFAQFRTLHERARRSRVLAPQVSAMIPLPAAAEGKEPGRTALIPVPPEKQMIVVRPDDKFTVTEWDNVFYGSIVRDVDPSTDVLALNEYEQKVARPKLPDGTAEMPRQWEVQNANPADPAGVSLLVRPRTSYASIMCVNEDDYIESTPFSPAETHTITIFQINPKTFKMASQGHCYRVSALLKALNESELRGWLGGMANPLRKYAKLPIPGVLIDWRSVNALKFLLPAKTVPYLLVKTGRVQVGSLGGQIGVIGSFHGREEDVYTLFSVSLHYMNQKWWPAFLKWLETSGADMTNPTVIVNLFHQVLNIPVSAINAEIMSTIAVTLDDRGKNNAAQAQHPETEVAHLVAALARYPLSKLKDEGKEHSIKVVMTLMSMFSVASRAAYMRSERDALLELMYEEGRTVPSYCQLVRGFIPMVIGKFAERGNYAALLQRQERTAGRRMRF
jgi:hypothetical protein